MPVGSLPANDFGLHEMHGNVAEWCWDVFSPDYYGQRTSVVDPMGPPAAEWDSDRVIRGGWWELRAPNVDQPADIIITRRIGLVLLQGSRGDYRAGAIAQQTPTPATKSSPSNHARPLFRVTYLLRGTRGQVPDDPALK